MAREQVSRYYYQRQVARWRNLSFRSKTLMRGLHIRAGEKKVRATMTARRCSQHASSRRKNRVVGKEEEGGEKKKKERKKREAIVDVSSRLVERRSPDTGGMLVRRAGELFRKHVRVLRRMDENRYLDHLPSKEKNFFQQDKICVLHIYKKKRKKIYRSRGWPFSLHFFLLIKPICYPPVSYIFEHGITLEKLETSIFQRFILVFV